jgi:asparagine N-glycosylation enzyme membrane subunit Stt3
VPLLSVLFIGGSAEVARRSARSFGLPRRNQVVLATFSGALTLLYALAWALLLWAASDTSWG